MSKSSPQVILPGYRKYESRRIHKKGGGVSIYVIDKILSREQPDLQIVDATFEHCIAEIKLKERKLLVGSLYRVPNTNQLGFLKDYKELVHKLKNTNSEVILGMDHNLDFLKSHLHKNTQNFINYNLDNDLFPVITHPTHITHSTATLIDNILLESRLTGQMTSKILIDDISDHLPCVTIIRNLLPSKAFKRTITSQDIRPKNLESLREDLAASIPIPNPNLDVNTQFLDFHILLQSKIEKHCPINTRTISKRNFRNGLLISSHKQQVLYQASLRKNSPYSSTIKYRNYRNLLTKLKCKCKLNYYKDKCNEFCRNTKKLWHVINTCIGKENDKTNIINYIKVGNVDVYDSKLIADEMGQFFSTIASNYAKKIPASHTKIDDYLKVITKNDKSIFLNPTNFVEVTMLISRLPNKKSSGYDNIDNILLKSIKGVVSEKLASLFNLSMSAGVFPEMMKLAEVVPLYKSKERFLTSNYRPISLLITISKILENIIYKRTYEFLDKNNQFYNSQYGFRYQHSCKNAIAELVGNILKNKENGKTTISLFLDLSKAFDSLQHETLLKKLEIYGIRGTPLEWFCSYLKNRTMRAKCTTGLSHSELSQTYKMGFGTPQGSCLRPLLFIIFYNDLNIHLTYLSCIQFADDTTLYGLSKSIRLLQCEIEHDLAVITDWFRANKLTLNADKTISVIFNLKNDSNIEITLKLGDHTIPCQTETKFLGVWIDKNLDWNKHVDVLLIKLRQNVGLLKKSKNILDRPALRTVYYAHIHSHLSYAILIWGSMLSTKQIQKLQKVQNTCLKIIEPSMNISESFKKLKILRISQLVRLELNKLAYKHTHNLQVERAWKNSIDT